MTASGVLLLHSSHTTLKHVECPLRCRDGRRLTVEVVVTAYRALRGMDVAWDIGSYVRAARFDGKPADKGISNLSGLSGTGRNYLPQGKVATVAA